MKAMIPVVVLMVCVTALIAGAAGRAIQSRSHGCAKTPGKHAEKTLRAFSSDQELKCSFLTLAADHKRALRQLRSWSGIFDSSGGIASTGTSPVDSITNVQHAGVDEGGIVKRHGDHLVVLRRGRLFTVAIGDRELKPAATVDAFGSDIDPRGTWYDEMSIAGDTVIVIGFSYERHGTEIGLFDIDRLGNLRYRATYHLRSHDYYSSRNYASRLIGTKLVFYTPLYVNPEDDDPLRSLPALRKWHKGAGDDEFQRITPATRVYRAESPIDALGVSLHTVTVCDLARADLECEATATLGPPGHVFYVSPDAVYVWASDWPWPYGNWRFRRRSMLYRMPLDGSAPSALQVSGSPVDQFSFLESGDRHLNVVVRSEAAGAGMWRAEAAQGDVSLLRVDLDSFSDGSQAAPRSSYRRLPTPAGYTFQNRFVGEHLLYGTGSGWGHVETTKGSRLYIARWADGEPVQLALPHGVDRIEALGSDAVVAGSDGQNLHLTTISLTQPASVASHYVRKGASQGELRSHGFFYKAAGPNAGLLGLPIRGPARPGYEHLFESSASIMFLRNDALRMSEVGDLAARSEGSADDGCRASCVDWYGNARPLFVDERVFGLLGYEIVEGIVADGRIQETRRINYQPWRGIPGR